MAQLELFKPPEGVVVLELIVFLFLFFIQFESSAKVNFSI